MHWAIASAALIALPAAGWAQNGSLFDAERRNFRGSGWTFSAGYHGFAAQPDSLGDGQCDFTDSVGDSRLFEGPPSPIAQSEVDAPAALVCSLPGVGSAFEDVDVVAKLGKHQGPKAAHQARAHNGHFFRRQSVLHFRGHGGKLAHGRFNGLIEVSNEVVRVLDPHAQSDKAV